MEGAKGKEKAEKGERKRGHERGEERRRGPHFTLLVTLLVFSDVAHSTRSVAYCDRTRMGVHARRCKKHF